MAGPEGHVRPRRERQQPVTQESLRVGPPGHAGVVPRGPEEHGHPDQRHEDGRGYPAGLVSQAHERRRRQRRHRTELEVRMVLVEAQTRSAEQRGDGSFEVVPGVEWLAMTDPPTPRSEPAGKDRSGQQKAAVMPPGRVVAVASAVGHGHTASFMPRAARSLRALPELRVLVVVLVG